MRIEIPQVSRCCFCMPLRRGLLFWIYLKLVFGLLLLTHVIFCIINVVSRTSSIFNYVFFSLALIMTLVDIAFCVLFLISAHKKNHDYMRIYYRYAIGLLIIELLAMLGFIGFEIYVTVVSMPYIFFIAHLMAASTCFIFVQIVMQVYLVILVRSEVVKLEKSTNFEFINHASEPQCTAQIYP